MGENNARALINIDPLALLTILFVGLKLTGYINWSWWWVLAPMWVPIAAILAFALCAVLVVLVMFAYDKMRGIL